MTPSNAFAFVLFCATTGWLVALFVQALTFCGGC